MIFLLYTEGVRWRWVFSSSLLPSTGRWPFLPDIVLRAAERVPCGLFEALFPDDCRICGEALHKISRVPVCSRCLRNVEPLEAEFFCVRCRTPFVNRHPLDDEGRCPLCRLGLAGFDAVYSYGSYEGNLRELIHLFKYEKIRTLARPLGELLALALPREERFDAVVPIPLHWRRRWERGFNQSKLLAKEIARRWNAPVVEAVRRVKATAPQAGLTNAKRRANVSGAFSAKRPRFQEYFGRGFPFVRSTPLKGARVLLIDDVLTTGATAAACARALKRAGASRVTLAAVARTDRRTEFIDFRADSGADFRETGSTASAVRAGGRT